MYGRMVGRQIDGDLRVKLRQFVHLPRIPVTSPIVSGFVNDGVHILIQRRLRLHKRLLDTAILRATPAWMFLIARLLLAGVHRLTLPWPVGGTVRLLSPVAQR